MENSILNIFKTFLILISVFSEYFSAFFLIALIISLYDKLKNKNSPSFLGVSPLKYCLLFSFFIFGVFNFYMFHFSSSTTQIGSIYEADYFEETYYVYFYYDNKTTKCYKIPAQIFANEESKYYSILNVQWPNGNVIYFPDDSYVLPNVKSHIEYIDSNGDDAECFIELTTEKYKK